MPASGLGLRGLGLLAPLSGRRLGLVLLAGCGPRVALVNVLAGSLLTLRRFGRCPLLRADSGCPCGPLNRKYRPVLCQTRA